MTVHPSILERVGTGLFVGGIRSLSTLAGGVRIPLLAHPPGGCRDDGVSGENSLHDERAERLIRTR